MNAGIVFLLFTIGLNFSLPQIHTLRHVVLGLGTGQIVLTTAIVAVVAWLAGLPLPAAFVVGAGVVITALVRSGQRVLRPPPESVLETNDALVLFGTPDDLQRAESALLG